MTYELHIATDSMLNDIQDKMLFTVVKTKDSSINDTLEMYDIELCETVGCDKTEWYVYTSEQLERVLNLPLTDFTRDNGHILLFTCVVIRGNSIDFSKLEEVRNDHKGFYLKNLAEYLKNKIYNN